MRKIALFAMAVATAACSGRTSTTTDATDDAPSADQRRAIEALRAETGRSWRVLVAGSAKLPIHVSASRDGETPVTGARPTRIDPVETTLSLLETNKTLFKLRDPRAALRMAKSEVDELGMTHARFQQQTHGIPITGAEMTAHYDALGRITSLDSNAVTGVDDLDVQPSVDADASVAIAKSEAAAHQVDADESKMVASAPTLAVYAREGREPRLAWKNVVRAVYGSDPHLWVTHVDAKTGAVLERYDNLQHAEGSGVGVLGDTKKLQITAQGGSFVMTDTSRGVTITTHTSNGQEVVVGQGATVVRSNDANSWDTVGVGKGAAVDAHFYAGVVFDHYKKVHARNGLDGAGGPLLSTVHYGSGMANSFWDGTSMSYGDGSGGSKAESAALDIVGHEFTHGVTSATSNLEYQGQSGALNESVSDVMAVFIEHAAKPDDTKNWLLFEDVGGGIRDMKDPTKHQQPSNMKQFVNTQQDQGGVHINSGIPNNAMALMTVGGTNPGSRIEVKFGIGWEKSEKLWFRAATKYFQTRTNFAQAAQGLMQAAKDIALTENEQNIVDCSLKAVGLATGACAKLVDPSPKAPTTVPPNDDDPRDDTNDDDVGTEEEESDEDETTTTTKKPKKKKTTTQAPAAGCTVGATTGTTGTTGSGLALGAALLAALGIVLRLRRRVLALTGSRRLGTLGGAMMDGSPRRTAQNFARTACWVLLASAVGCEGTTGRVTPITLPPPPTPTPTAVTVEAPPLPPAPPVVVEGAPAPAKQPIDPKFKVDGSGLLLGLTSTELWYLLGDHYTVVIDRATGCAVEGYPDPPVLVALRKNTVPASVEAQLKKPEVLQAIRDWVGLGRRLGAQGQHFLMESAWSLDGRFIYLELNDLLYRSADGGRSFARVDDVFSSRLSMSRDGRHLVYERCITADCPSCGRAYGAGCNSGRHYVSLPTDGSRGPVGFTAGQTFLLEQRADGRAMFWRSETEICADTFELGQPVRESAVCVPFPAKATGVWPGREWQSVSPSGRYGIVKWEEGRPNLAGAVALTYVVSLVDMTTKQILKEVTDVRGEVDDEGNMVAQSMSEGGGDHTYFYPRKGPRKLLGHHHLVAWHDKTAILGVHRVAKLGDRKCDLIKSVKTPPP